MKKLCKDLIKDVKRYFGKNTFDDREFIVYPKYKVGQFFYYVGWSIENYKNRIKT